MFDFDILVAGGGIAGLAAASAFGARGLSVLCVDPTAPVTDRTTGGADMRTTAVLQPGRALLEAAGIWEHLSAEAMPLEVMRIVDAGGPNSAIRSVRDFRASEISDAPFGWNLRNVSLSKAALQRIMDQPEVSFRPGVAVSAWLGRDDAALVWLSDGSRIRVRLVVAADGRGSLLRQMAGIGVQTARYGQNALAFAVTHRLPHENVSTEIHRTGGPFTLVPLPDENGRPCSAVVWMDDGPEMARRMTLDAADFEREMTERSCHVAGELSLASRRSMWPIISQRARRLTARRLALIAEAAHVMPPIGAQGLNTSLKDIAALLDALPGASNAIGGRAMLDRYASVRGPDIALRLAGIDVLNRASQVAHPALRDARGAALSALHALAPVRRGLMRLGLGHGDPLAGFSQIARRSQPG